MSQRHSEYDRRENDLYETPEWVTQLLLQHLPFQNNACVWEPAAGNMKIADVLKKHPYISYVGCTDLNNKHPLVSYCDFLNSGSRRVRGPLSQVSTIITNPPYGSAQEFIETALEVVRPVRGVVAMLLRTDYDHAVTRRHLFDTGSVFAKKVVLTKRIVWFPKKGAAPSFNHAWFIWDWRYEGSPALAYAHPDDIIE